MVNREGVWSFWSLTLKCEEGEAVKPCTFQGVLCVLWGWWFTWACSSRKDSLSLTSSLWFWVCSWTLSCLTSKYRTAATNSARNTHREGGREWETGVKSVSEGSNFTGGNQRIYKIGWAHRFQHKVDESRMRCWTTIDSKRERKREEYKLIYIRALPSVPFIRSRTAAGKSCCHFLFMEW